MKSTKRPTQAKHLVLLTLGYSTVSLYLLFAALGFYTPISNAAQWYSIVSVFTLGLLAADMLQHKIYHRTFWLLNLLLFTPLTAPLYLFQRNRLIRLGQRFNRP